MHYYIGGKEFEQPENVSAYSRRDYESLFAFRHQEDPSQMLQVRQEQLPYSVDQWEVSSINPRMVFVLCAVSPVRKWFLVSCWPFDRMTGNVSFLLKPPG